MILFVFFTLAGYSLVTRTPVALSLAGVVGLLAMLQIMAMP